MAGGLGSPSPRRRRVVRGLGLGGRQQGPAPRPSAPPGVDPPAARPTREHGGSGRSGRRGPVRGGGPTHLPLGWPARDFLEPPSREAGPAQRLLPLSSTPLLPPLSPIVVVPARAPFSAPAAPQAPPGVEFCGRGAVTALPLECPFLWLRKEKSSCERILKVGT